jgi:hypothetical protein
MAWNNTGFKSAPRAVRWFHQLYRVLWELFLPIMAAAILLTAFVNRHPMVSILTAVIIVLGAISVSRLRCRSALGALLGGAIVLLAFIPILFGTIAPRMDPLWISRDVAEKVAEIRKTDPELRLYSVAYKEPSLVFLTGTNTRLCDLKTIETDYNVHMAVLLPDSDAEKLSVPLVSVASVSGINYSKGQILNQGLYLHPGSDYEKHK